MLLKNEAEIYGLMMAFDIRITTIAPSIFYLLLRIFPDTICTEIITQECKKRQLVVLSIAIIDHFPIVLTFCVLFSVLAFKLCVNKHAQ